MGCSRATRLCFTVVACQDGLPAAAAAHHGVATPCPPPVLRVATLTMMAQWYVFLAPLARMASGAARLPVSCLRCHWPRSARRAHLLCRRVCLGWRSRAARSSPRDVGVARMAQWCRALSSLVPASKASGPSNSSNLSKPSVHPVHSTGCSVQAVASSSACYRGCPMSVWARSSPLTPGRWGDPPFDRSSTSVSSCGAGSSVDSISSCGSARASAAVNVGAWAPSSSRRSWPG